MNCEFEIELTQKNYFDFLFHNFVVGKGIIKGISLCIIGGFCFYIWLFLLFNFSFNVKIFLSILMFITTILICCLTLAITWNNHAKTYLRNNINNLKFIICEKQFSVENRITKDEKSANAILKSYETKNYLFLYQTINTAWIIPKQQLNENTYNNIIDFIKKNKIPFEKQCN